MNAHARNIAPASRSVGPARARLLATYEMVEDGQIKWYDPDRRYGFITTPRGAEVFFHKSDLKLYGLRESDVAKGVCVKFKSETKPGRRPEVIAISLA